MGKRKFDIFNTMQEEMAVNSNNIMYSRFCNYLYNIATSRCCWNSEEQLGFPSSLIEKILVENGEVALCDTQNAGLVISSFSAGYTFNLRNMPNMIRLFPYGATSNHFFQMLGSHKYYSRDFEICYNNNSRTGLMTSISSTAIMMVETWFTIMSNIQQQKFPTIVEADQSEKLSMEFINKSIEGGKNIIVLRRGTAQGYASSTVFNRDVPYVADKLTQHFNNIIDLFLSEIGVNTVQTEKKERLIVDEVNANNERAGITTQSFMENRRDFCRRVNEKFGINLTVEIVKGGVSRGTIYGADATVDYREGLDG